jgi:hypothetical protein
MKPTRNEKEHRKYQMMLTLKCLLSYDLVIGGSWDACSERGALELHAALLISQAHHNEVIFSATRNSIIWEEGDLNFEI